MYFIVLTHDERLPFVELMIKSYKKFFPKYNFKFIIPYNNPDIVEKLQQIQDNIICVNSGKSIKETIYKLTKNIKDNEFVYWCTDDRYLDKLFAQPQIFINIYKYLNIINNSNIKLNNLDAIRILSSASINEGKKIKIGKYIFYKDRALVVHGFWNHHFIKNKILKNIFLNNKLDNDFYLPDLHKYMEKNHKLFRHNIYSAQNSICQFGETTYRGKITKNCKIEFAKYKIKRPNLPHINVRIYFNGKPIIIKE